MGTETKPAAAPAQPGDEAIATLLAEEQGAAAQVDQHATAIASEAAMIAEQGALLEAQAKARRAGAEGLVSIMTVVPVLMLGPEYQVTKAEREELVEVTIPVLAEAGAEPPEWYVKNKPYFDLMQTYGMVALNTYRRAQAAAAEQAAKPAPPAPAQVAAPAQPAAAPAAEPAPAAVKPAEPAALVVLNGGEADLSRPPFVE